MSEQLAKLAHRPLIYWVKLSALFIFCLLWLNYCSPPKLGWWLSGPANQTIEVYSARLLEKFPIGSSEENLLNFLEDSNFKIFPREEVLQKGQKYRRSAMFSRPAIICVVDWRIYWNSEEGKITELEAVKSSSCL